MRRLMAVLAAAGAMSAWAATEWANDYTWTYTTSDGKATITGVSPEGSGKVTIPSSFSGGSLPVTSIGASVFYGCAGMTAVTLPAQLENVGPCAFRGCTTLTTLRFPPCLQSIDHEAFYGCSKLSYLYFGTNTAEMCAMDVAVDAFCGCTKLGTVLIRSGLSGWCQSEFANVDANPLWYSQALYGASGMHEINLRIPSGVTQIGSYAFCHCDATNAVIPASVRRIGEHAFFFSKLESVRFLGRGLKSIEDGAFNGCYLAEFEIPPGVTNVGADAFCDCPYLKAVSIPISVRRVGDNAFQNTTKLKTVYVDSGDKARVRAMLEGSGKDTSGITFEEVDLSSVEIGFDPNGGKGDLDGVEFTKLSYFGFMIGDTFGALPALSWAGHEQLGWFTAKDGGTRITASTVIDAPAIYYARWRLKEYRLSFNANGGTCAQTYIDTEYCLPYGALPVPTRSGYTFNGWFTAKTGGTQVTSSTKCTGNKTVYAQWTIKQYKLSYSANGGSVSPAYKMVNYCAKYGTLPTPTWGGHTFNGWFTAKTGGTKVTADTKCTGNRTIYAQWTIKQYKLTYNANGGTVSPASKMINYCATYGTLPTPIWAGHTFNGWFTAKTGGTQVTSSTKCTGNATIYAQWTVKQYTITFNANGGTVTPASQKVNYCATYTLPTPSWSGHTFKGWYTAASGGTKVTSPAKCTGNATLYARW